MQCVIPPSWEGKLLRSYLQWELGLSARMISRLKAHPQGLLLDGERVTVRALLHSGALLTLATEDVRPTHTGSIVPAATSPMPRILLEDEDLLLCDKPAGLPTHPSHGHYTDTLANALAYLAGAKDENAFCFHPITRLDRDTSGVVLSAKHALSAQRLTDAMMAQRIRKVYLALLCGQLPEPSGEIVTGIRRCADSIITREVTPLHAERSRPAHTRYRTLLTLHAPDGSPLTLVAASPLTGRTHQLRLHFAHLGTPLLGDSLYGTRTPPAFMPRHALHCAALTLPHPRSGEQISIQAPLPEDMRALLPPAQRESCLDEPLSLLLRV